MKKLKLLSSLSALLLVLSVGACDKNTEDETSEEPTISELENYTLSVSFEADGTVAAIPEYGTAYIIGGWDSWGAFIPLKADDGKYVTTFDTIAVGTHEYKIVMWYTDQDVSWSDCIEITTTNQTLKVEASQGNDFTKEITHTLDVELPEPLTDDEIISDILEEASNYEYADEIGWEAYHYTEVEEYWECEGEYYLTQDEDENVYGSAYTSDEGDVTYSYFRGGSKYNYYPDEDPDDQYSKVEFNDVYTYAIEYFLEPFEILTSYGEEDDGLDLDDYTVTVTKEITNYRYTLELVQNEVYESGEEGSSEYYYCETTYTYTYVCDTHFNLIAVGYEMDDDEEGLTSYFAESITYEDVEAQMSGFNPYQWDIAHSPAELVEEAALTCNWSIEFEWTTYESANPMAYADYSRLSTLNTYLPSGIDPDTSESLVDEDGNWVEGGEERYGALYAEYVELYAIYDNLFDELAIEQSYVADAYYSDDYMLYICNELNESGEYELYLELIYVIEEDGTMWQYYTYNGYQWSVGSYDASYGYHWSDTTYSLLDEYYTYNSASHLEYQGSGTTTDGSSYDVYDFDDWTYNWSYGYISTASAYWFTCLGGYDLFGSNAYSYGLYSFIHYYTYFFPKEQIMQSIYTDGGGLYRSDNNYDENTTVFYIEDDVFITLYDVGETDASEEVYYWHNYWQDYLASQQSQGD